MKRLLDLRYLHYKIFQHFTKSLDTCFFILLLVLQGRGTGFEVQRRKWKFGEVKKTAQDVAVGEAESFSLSFLTPQAAWRDGV